MSAKIPPPIVMLLCAVMMYAADRLLPMGEVGFLQSRPIGSFIVLVGIAINIAAAVSFRKAGTTISPLSPEKASSLVDTGLFARSRNPIYVAMAIILVGVAFLLGNAISLAGVPLFVWYITQFQIKPEEAALGQVFGDTYAEYCKRVRRWI